MTSPAGVTSGITTVKNTVLKLSLNTLNIKYINMSILGPLGHCFCFFFFLLDFIFVILEIVKMCKNVFSKIYNMKSV